MQLSSVKKSEEGIRELISIISLKRHERILFKNAYETNEQYFYYHIAHLSHYFKRLFVV